MSGFTIPIVVLGIILVFVASIAIYASRYKRCKPNEVIVIYGKKRTVKIPDPANPGQFKEVERGYRLLTGGGAFIKPIIESFSRISLSTFQVNFQVTDTPNIDGVLVTVDALANMKVSSDPGLLDAAVERLLEKQGSNIEDICRQTLEAQLRQLCGNLKIEEIIQDRVKISQQVMETAAGDLNKLGFQVDNFLITKITDKEGYIEALGKKRTAEVKRDAAIAKAEAQREEDVKTAEADRIGKTAKAAAEKAVSDAERDKDVAVADNLTLVKKRQARIEIEAQAAGEDARAELERKRIAADMARVEADTELQTKEKQRKEAELDATTVTTARKEAEARIIRAQAEQDAASREGEAARILQEKQGLGEQAKLTAVAAGRKEAAAANQAEMVAQAAGKQADLLADAAGVEAAGKAAGEAILAKLTAEAEGFEKKNRALSNLSEGAKLIMVLEKLPEIINEFGDAGEAVMGAMFEHVGAGLARIDDVKIIDFGGGRGDGSAVADHALNIPKIVFKTMAAMKETGLDFQGLLKKLGISTDQFQELMGGALNTGSEVASHKEEADTTSIEA